MDDFQEETYGARIAPVYDKLYPDLDPAIPQVLSELAAGGKALELGIGTGRVALPLQRVGVEVHGVDISEEMVARLRAKPGGERIPVTIGSFAETWEEGQFDLVYVLFNTFFALLTQEEQVRCFQEVARHLLPHGVFVVEAFVPDLTRFTGGQAVRAVNVGTDALQIDISTHDPVLQQVTSQHLMIGAEGVRLYPVKLRYAWPSELDLMAQLARMRLKARWGNWHKTQFGENSGKHISVYELAA